MENRIYEVSAGEEFSHAAKAAQLTAFYPRKVQFDFNGILCIVSRSTNLKELYRDYQNAHLMEWTTIGPDCVFEYSPEVANELARRNQLSQERCEKEMAEYRLKQAAERKAFAAKTEGVVFELADEALWLKGKANNTDDYGACIYEYAESWARLMQAEMAKGVSLVDCAARTSFELGFLGISGFMYGAAVSVLSKCWKYGETLRKLHNKEYSHNGDGVVNPAIMTFPSPP